MSTSNMSKQIQVSLLLVSRRKNLPDQCNANVTVCCDSENSHRLDVSTSVISNGYESLDGDKERRVRISDIDPYSITNERLDTGFSSFTAVGGGIAGTGEMNPYSITRHPAYVDTDLHPYGVTSVTEDPTSKTLTDASSSLYATIDGDPSYSSIPASGGHGTSYPSIASVNWDSPSASPLYAVPNKPLTSSPSALYAVPNKPSKTGKRTSILSRMMGLIRNSRADEGDSGDRRHDASSAAARGADARGAKPAPPRKPSRLKFGRWEEENESKVTQSPASRQIETEKHPSTSST